MKTSMMLTMLALTTLGAGALAAEPKPGPTPPKQPMAAPKPAAEMDMYKGWYGTWQCDSTTKAPDGTDMAYKSSWQFKKDLGGHWGMVTYKRAKTKTADAFEGHGMFGYNSADKNYTVAGHDDWGGWINLTSADGMAFAGEGTPYGQKGPFKITFAKGMGKDNKPSDKMLDVTLDFGAFGVATEHCKK